MSVVSPTPAGTINSTELVTSVNGVGVPAENIQRVIITKKTAPGTVTDTPLDVNMATALDKAFDSATVYPRGVNWLAITASTLIYTVSTSPAGQNGKFVGIWVSAASATPTLKVWDQTSAAVPILIDTFTPVAGTMYTFPHIRLSTGLYVSIGGTVSCTVFWDPTSLGT